MWVLGNELGSSERTACDVRTLERQAVVIQMCLVDILEINEVSHFKEDSICDSAM